MGKASRRKKERKLETPILEEIVKSRDKSEELKPNKTQIKPGMHDIYSLATNLGVIASLYPLVQSVKQSNDIEKFWDLPNLESIGKIVVLYGFVHVTYNISKLMYGLIKSRRQNFEKSGFYGITRNPIYLNHRTICLGAFLTKPTTKVLAASALIYAATEIAARVEEKQLEKRFGDEYIEYKNKVPRWVPNYLSDKADRLGMFFLKYSPFK